MQQAFKTVMNQMGPQSNQSSNAAFSFGSPFAYPPPATPGPSTSGFPYQSLSTSGLNKSSASAASAAPSQASSPYSVASEATVTVDVSATETESSGPTVVEDENEKKTEAKRSGIISFHLRHSLVAIDFLVLP